MGKDNIQYINLKEKDVLGRYLNEALKQIEKEQNYLKERFENLEWARLQEDKTVINKFLEKIILVRLVPGDD